jgi:hypothetical protein
VGEWVVENLRRSDDMFWCNIFTDKKDIVVVICDEELLGKKLKMKEKKITIEVSEKFYKGKLIDENMAMNLLGKATIGNLMGKNIVELASKNGFILKKNVILIDGVPHAQFVKL